MNPAQAQHGSAAEDICLTCGLCCNGVIFADVRLQPGDNAARLQALGLPLRAPTQRRSEAASTAGAIAPSAERLPRFTQPCAALEGCRCRIYAERPQYCREFECLLLKSVKAGRTPRAEAWRIIRTARQRADTVRRLLRELGDAEEQLPLSARFRRMSKRLQTAGLDEPKAELYGELTLAVHDLNLLLSQAFYPGSLPSP